MYGYIYLITNNINGKKYIGLRSSSTFDDSYWGSGKLIQKAIAKYGKENFTREILHWCETPEQLVECELREIINRNAAGSSEYYNLIATKTPILVGERNPFFGKHHSTQTKELISSKNRGRVIDAAELEKRQNFWTTEKGVKQKNQLSIDRSGKPLAAEHAEKIRSKMNSPEVKKQISAAKKKFYESQRGEEIKAQLAYAASERFKGVPKSPEQREKMSKSAVGKKKTYMKEVNRNPEKIKKTAEKNRGSKRSAESKKLMSDRAKGRVPKNKGCYYAHNPQTGEKRMLISGQEIPEGYVKGYGSRKHKI